MRPPLRVLQDRSRPPRNLEGGDYDAESLPSYTLVSGLPSYDEALEQLKIVHEQCAAARATNKTAEPQQKNDGGDGGQPQQQQTSLRLSVAEFLKVYKTYPSF
uniref:Uncharacterized protein n=1 Tax=Timema bartmani TaxID=61472 RepID=A0A7R9HWF4_9NEOP|nr:unnamed protein product [Timema bartmani]